MFQQVVNLYRALGCPSIEDNTFCFKGKVNSQVLELVQAMDKLPEQYGSFYQKKIDLKLSTVEIEFSLPGSEFGRFHANFNEFIQASPSLERGDLPEQYYIWGINYYSQDEKKPASIQSLSDCCEFIRLLSKLSVDGGSTEKKNINRLIFVLAADGKSPSRTFSLRTKIDTECAQLSIPHLNLLRALLSGGIDNKIYIEERRMIMQTAIAETLDSAPEKGNDFLFLVKNWREVLRRYKHNFQAFFHQFSFEKTRKEIATTEIEHATKLSGVLGDIAGKLLALPVSLGGLLLLRKATSIEEFIVLSIGLVVASAIFLGILYNQWLQVCRIRNAFTIVFGQYDKKLDAFPKSLRTPIRNAHDSIAHQGKVLKNTFYLFGFFAVLPVFGVAYIAWDIYSQAIFQNLLTAIVFIRSHISL